MNTAVLDSFVAQSNAPQLTLEGDQFVLSFEDHREVCEPLRQPRALEGTVPRFGKRSELAQMHSPSTLFLTPLRECIFGIKGQICQFCNFSGSTMRPAPPNEIAKVVRDVSQEMGRDIHVAIGSGTPNLNDGGASYFAKIAAAIRSVGEFPISVEMIPPQDFGAYRELKESGVQSLITSIEIWDERRRTAFLPGKSQISRSKYIDGWKAALDCFGAAQVSSVLLAGLEPTNSAKEGIDHMVAMGVIPTIIPFRPYDDIMLRDHSLCGIDTFLTLSNYNANALFRKQLSPFMQSGCTRCQGCSIDDPGEHLQGGNDGSDLAEEVA